jgi:hypothetical protein
MHFYSQHTRLSDALAFALLEVCQEIIKGAIAPVLPVVLDAPPLLEAHAA